jgi:magnesium transporter
MSGDSDAVSGAAFRKGDRDEARSAHPADLADELAERPAAEAARRLAALPVRRRAAVFGYIPPQAQGAIAHEMGRTDLAALVSAMSHDERADLFLRLEAADQEALLPALAQAEREDIRSLAAYPEGTAGSVMTSGYAAVPEGLTAEEALQALRAIAPDRETIYDTYVVDGDRRLVGVFSLRQLIVAPATAPVADFMRRDVVKARADEPREAAARCIARYDLLALPVVDAEGRLVGIVTADDAMDVQQEEATAEFHKAGTVRPIPDGVRGAGIGLLYRSRIAWLVLLVFGNVLSGLGIATFEDTIAANLALVFFLPLLIASGGNAGAQAATLMVRALATGDVRMSDWRRMLVREAVVAALLGVTMAGAVALIGVVRSGTEVALVAALSMVAIVLLGGLVGLALPFLLARLRLDPAMASAPLVTSIADASGVLIYLGIATALLAA